MSSQERFGEALAVVLERVVVTKAEVGARFPLFADPVSGRWTATGRGSWTGGFWAGLLWLRARQTGESDDRAAASACTARLAPWAEADTATRGLILWYGTALAAGDDRAAALRARAARACLTAMDHELGLVPWGSALGGPRMLARADGVPGVVQLLVASGPGGAVAAGQHLYRHLDLCLRDDQLQPAWHFAADTGWQPCDDPAPGWSRGRAWLLLAVADALHSREARGWRPDRLEAAAEQLVADGAALTGSLVPLADENRPEGHLDTSAAAVTAVALLKLARLRGPRSTEFSDRAAAILGRLVCAHLSAGDGDRPAGMLLDGCYDAGKGIAVQHELIWGDFFLALGLAALSGLVDVTEV